MAVKLSENSGLALWHGVLVAGLRGDLPDLTTRQQALLLHVYLSPPPHTVRGLAATLNMSKPAVTRALDRLGRLDFVRRKRDEADKRNILVQRTVKGAVFLREFAELVARTAADIPTDTAAG
ncbi:MAG: MarR family transcriptional regulator [Alphaproteobacteria bacterium]|nr:MAG: MarR family transcriptional regulator [Alphaproteobacteria bacterium]